MIMQSDLPQTLPLFPLFSALLLPRGRLPLHVFEPRYLAMVEDALRTDTRLIGMIQPVSNKPGDGGMLHKIGCAGRITSFTETPDRTYMITLTGISRFELGDIQDSFNPYMRADISWSRFSQDLKGTEQDKALDRTSFLALLGRYFEVSELETDWESLKEAKDEMLINALSALSPFDAKDKQALLEAQTLSQRRAILTTLMEFAVHGGAGEDRLQ